MKAVRFISSSLVLIAERPCRVSALLRDLAGFRARVQGTAAARQPNAIVASSSGMSAGLSGERVVASLLKFAPAHCRSMLS